MSEEKRRFHVEVLPCELTDEEIRMKGIELARSIQTETNLKDDLALEKERVKKLVKEEEHRQRELTRNVNTRSENREVRCYEERDVGTKKARVIRSDTGALVYERALTEQELQMPINLEARRGKKAAGGDAELD